MDGFVLAVFGVVYLGMILGGLPRLALDRTGVAVLGAIALVVGGRLSLSDAVAAVNVPTVTLLFALMVISAQFRLGGFYGNVTRRIAAAEASPQTLLALVVAVSGGLSALLANDIVCLAMVPLLIEGCGQRRLDPRPFLYALACASNVGSAATLIGNPQNILIGETLNLHFAGYLADASVPSVLGLGVVWGVIALRWRGRWVTTANPAVEVDARLYDRWQSSKGILVILGVVGAFLFSTWPRDLVALSGAGVLLLSRRMHSRVTLGLVDWPLILLFVGLFVVHAALEQTGMPARALDALARNGADLRHPAWLFGATLVLSNLVSNVPAVMLLLPAAGHPQAGAILALSSTLAGNLLLVGSIANLIVADQAARLGVRLGWREHARIGIPVSTATLGLAALWLAVRA